MSDALTIVLTSAGVAAFISVVGAVVNGQLQRRQDLNLRRAEEARQLRDAKRERLWSGLQILAEVAMGVQEANVDLMRGPEYADETQKRGDDLYALVEGHRAECVLGSREGRDLLLGVVGAIRRYQALAVDVKSHYSILAARGTNDPEAAGRRQRIDQEHDAIQRAAWDVLNRARALLDALEQPAYAPASPQRLQHPGEDRQRVLSPWGW